MKRLMVTLALCALGCGGEPPAQSGTPSTPSAAPSATPNVAPTQAPSGRATGVVHDVNMEGAKGKFFFTPATLTIRSGDVVRFHNVSGGPHNVQFKKDRVPAGALQVLNAAMANRLGDLTGPIITKEGEVYEVSFVGAPPGSYTYACQPHEMLGMTAMIAVTP
jgi:plastocyanin